MENANSLFIHKQRVYNPYYISDQPTRLTITNANKIIKLKHISSLLQLKPTLQTNYQQFIEQSHKRGKTWNQNQLPDRRTDIDDSSKAWIQNLTWTMMVDRINRNCYSAWIGLLQATDRPEWKTVLELCYTRRDRPVIGSWCTGRLLFWGLDGLLELLHLRRTKTWSNCDVIFLSMKWGWG